MMDTYYACACPGRKLKKDKIELKYPSDALPMVVDYLDKRYEIVGFSEDFKDEEGCLQSIPLKFYHRDYDNEKGYLLILDDHWSEVFAMSVIFEEEDIYWPWVERWGEEIFELHLLPNMKGDWFEWCWKDNKPGVAARVWRKQNLLEAYRWHYDHIGGAWGKRYAKLLAEMLLEERMEDIGTLIRVKAGTMKFKRTTAPLWLEVMRDPYKELPPHALDVKYLLSFRPEWDILPAIRLAEPESIIVGGSAFKSRLSLRVSLYYSSPEKALKAVDRLSEARILKKANIRRAIINNIGKLGEIPIELMGLLSLKATVKREEELSPEERNYLEGVDLLDPKRRGKWLLKFGKLPLERLKRAVLFSYVLTDSGWRGEEKKVWLIRNGYSEGELRARKIAHELLEVRECW
jgi:hypothetical protein